METDTGVFEIKKYDGRCHAAQPVVIILNLESEELKREYPDGIKVTLSKEMAAKLDEEEKSKYQELLAFLKNIIKKPPRGFEVKQIS